MAPLVRSCILLVFFLFFALLGPHSEVVGRLLASAGGTGSGCATGGGAGVATVPSAATKDFLQPQKQFREFVYNSLLMLGVLSLVLLVRNLHIPPINQWQYWNCR